MRALLDTNLLVASAVYAHPHRDVALAVFEQRPDHVVAAHSLAEAYNTLTRARIYNWEPHRAWAVVQQIGRRFDVRHLTGENYLAALETFANGGGKGPQVHDALIGYHAIAHALPVLVTLNDRDFRPLFPSLKVLTPQQYLETH